MLEWCLAREKLGHETTLTFVTDAVALYRCLCGVFCVGRGVFCWSLWCFRGFVVDFRVEGRFGQVLGGIIGNSGNRDADSILEEINAMFSVSLTQKMSPNRTVPQPFLFQ